ncbi:oligosaccharide flippase family protein [Paraburkholderia sp. J7]|uniref:oligosaccharide flippase family protein n=1 Tax=Paraburkholderia sp. J7 TaxID=2805438 RepID=UPI002AB7D795|nr:oligosaccharide flippase family protein [Paraburkholderia sp. J7]
MIRARDSVISLAGVLTAQLIFFLCISLIGRHSGPHALGSFNSTLAAGMFIGTLLGLRFELACVSDDPRQAFSAYVNVVALSLVLFVTLEVVALASGCANYLTVGLFAFAFFLQQASSFYLNSLRRYGWITLSRVGINLAFLVAIFIRPRVPVLSATSDFGIYTVLNLLASLFNTTVIFRNGIRADYLLRLSREFFLTNRRFAKYILPSTLCGSVLTYSLAIVFPLWFGPMNAGYFAAAYRLGFFPVSLIGQSLGGVFRRDALSAVASSKSNSESELTRVYRTYARALALLSVAYLAGGLLLFSPLVALLFGPQWNSAADYFRRLAPLFALQLVYVPLSQIFLVRKQQRTDFLFQLQSGVTLIGALGACRLLNLASQNSVLIFSITGALTTLFGLALTKRVARDRPTALT